MIFKPGSNPSDDAVLLRWGSLELSEILSTSDCTIRFSNIYAAKLNQANIPLVYVAASSLIDAFMAETRLQQGANTSFTSGFINMHREVGAIPVIDVGSRCYLQGKAVTLTVDKI